LKKKHPNALPVAEQLAGEVAKNGAAILASGAFGVKVTSKAQSPSLVRFANKEDKLRSVTTSMLRYIVDAHEPLSTVTSKPFRRMLAEVAPAVPPVGKDRLMAALQLTEKVVRDKLPGIWKGEMLAITTGK
jgi:hypothetical protein